MEIFIFVLGKLSFVESCSGLYEIFNGRRSKNFTQIFGKVNRKNRGN
jgi:hypothetical protein